MIFNLFLILVSLIYLFLFYLTSLFVYFLRPPPSFPQTRPSQMPETPTPVVSGKTGPSVLKTLLTTTPLQNVPSLPGNSGSTSNVSTSSENKENWPTASNTNSMRSVENSILTTFRQVNLNVCSTTKINMFIFFYSFLYSECLERTTPFHTPHVLCILFFFLLKKEQPKEVQGSGKSFNRA